jgi:asparagine synthase (glutamine-hydrolysing)
MTRPFAGIFDPSGRASSSRLAGALAPHPSTVTVHGPLQLASSGPESGSGGPLLCLLDGCLDNSSELSAALEVPAAASPEELLAAGWRRWGRELLPRLRGDFAVAIWDREQDEGVLARDQMGIRSMFLYGGPGALFFATEIRHLLALLPRRPVPDPEGVAHWIAVSGRPGSGTLYAGVRRLDPGGMVLMERGVAREQRYWTPRFADPLDVSGPELSSRIRESIGCAVQRRLSPSGVTGVMMSGGLDSASIAAVAAAQAPGQVAAYSAAFPEHPAVDESDLIDELRNELSLPGVTAQVRPGGLVASAVETVEAWQVPLASWGDFWAVPLLRAAASAGVKTMLGGDGGDELFGIRISLLADRLRAGHPLQALELAREFPGAGDRPPRRAVARVMRDWGLLGALPYTLHTALRRPFAGRDAPEWLCPRTARDLIDSDDPLAWKRLDGPRWWASTVHLLTRVAEEAGVFEGHRHRSAAAGIEARHPLFDLDLLELGLRQPPLATFDRHLDRPVMRSSMEDLLPDAVRLRPHKALFDSVLVDSLAGPDRAAVHDLLLDPRAELGAYVDLEGVRRTVLADGASSVAPFQWMQQLWRLITIECWLRAQSDPRAEALPAEALASPASITLQPAPS